VCLVTGSSSGIGKVAARELAKMGATAVMVCRNRAKGEAVQAEIKELSGNTHVDLIIDVAVRKHLWHVSEELIRPYVQLSVNG